MRQTFPAPAVLHPDRASADTEHGGRATAIQKPTRGRLPRLTVSLKTLAAMLDAHRSSVRRWLTDAGVHPIVVGRGRNAGIRYRWVDIERWLDSREQID
jgi:hypothetical protein